MTHNNYTTEFKTGLVKKYALAQKDGSFTSIVSFLRDNAPNVSKSSFYKWRDLYLDEVASELGLSQNEVQGVYGSQANALPMSEKFKIILEVSKLSDVILAPIVATKACMLLTLRTGSRSCPHS